MAFFDEASPLGPMAAGAPASNIRGELEQLRARLETVLQQLDAAGAAK
jgi:hypothetical protein